MSVPWPRGKGARTCSPSDGGTAALSALRPSLPPRGSFPLVKPAACCLPPPWVPVGTVRTASELHSGKISFIQRLYFCIFFFSCPSIPEFCSLERGQRGLPGPGRAEQVYGAVRGLVAPSRGRSANCSGTPLGGSSPGPSRAGVPLPEAQLPKGTCPRTESEFSKSFSTR